MSDAPLEIVVRDRKFFVTFVYNYAAVGKNRTGEAITTCLIRTYNPMLTITGVAVCNPHDLTNRRVGETVAFRRAVSQNMLGLIICTGVLSTRQLKREFDHAFRHGRFERDNPDWAAGLAAEAEAREKRRARLAAFEAIYAAPDHLHGGAQIAAECGVPVDGDAE